MVCMNLKENILLTFFAFLLKPFTSNFIRRVKFNKTVSQTINLYKDDKFIPIRFWGAPFIEVEKLIPTEGFIVDLGCGEGVFTNFLGVSSAKRKVLGIEIDKQRLKKADRGIQNVSFRWGDVTKIKLPNVDTIILFHVLHHLNSQTEQESVINKCFNQLKSGGQLIIVEVEPKLSLTYIITWLTDHFIVPWLFERRLYSSIFFRKSSEWKKILKKTGFDCRVINAEKGHPFAHTIISCKSSF